MLASVIELCCAPPEFVIMIFHQCSTRNSASIIHLGKSLLNSILARSYVSPRVPVYLLVDRNQIKRDGRLPLKGHAVRIQGVVHRN